MKKFNKSTATVLSVVLSIILLVGVIFSFVPMKFGTKSWKSFAGTIGMSSDITGGLYGEFNIKTENPSDDDIVSSLNKIKDVFEQDGYKNVNVYAIGKEKIRIETGYSKSSRTYAETYNKIASVAVGAFSLRTTYEVEEKTISVIGSEAVKSVKVYTNNETNYLTVKFNKVGEAQYKYLCDNAESGSIYIALGDYAQQISIAGLASYSEFTLSDANYDSLIELKDNIILGCMKVELDAASYDINTMSASLTTGESSSSPEFASYARSTVLVVMLSALLTVVVLLIAYLAVRFGFYALVTFITLVTNATLFVIILNLIPSVELGLSSFVVLIIGISIIYTYAYQFAGNVKKEYAEGKSLSASLESAYKKSFASVLISNLMLFAGSLLLIAFSFGEITSAAIVFAICAFLSLFTNLALIPFIVKICISYGNFGFKLFMLKKRLDFSMGSEDADKEAE
ncbi:MAG: MMPL family transporter [Clostridia bacterium]|nr:MMPL family transporter [Clostridia bacterium]